MQDINLLIHSFIFSTWCVIHFVEHCKWKENSGLNVGGNHTSQVHRVESRWTAYFVLPITNH